MLRELLDWEHEYFRQRFEPIEAALRRYVTEMMMTMDEFKDSGLVLEEDAPTPDTNRVQRWRIKDRDERVVAEGCYCPISLLPGGK